MWWLFLLEKNEAEAICIGTFGFLLVVLLVVLLLHGLCLLWLAIGWWTPLAVILGLSSIAFVIKYVIIG